MTTRWEYSGRRTDMQRQRRTGPGYDALRRAKTRVLRGPRRWLKQWATREIGRRTKSVVASGPFAGMKFVERHVFGGLMPKLLGTYEKELHQVVSAFATSRFDGVINIGAGEGYYAVGLARLLPHLPVVAYEALEEGRELIGIVARANAVSDRLDIRGTCTREGLESLLRRDKRYLIVCDVEGAEVDLFHPSTIELVRSSVLLMESHDFRVPGCTEEMTRRFEPTHVVVTVVSRDRQSADFPLPFAIPDRIKVWVMNEGRPREPPMRWLVMTPRFPAARV